MVNVRIDADLKKGVAEVLAGMGLTISDVIRMLLTRIATDGRLPEGLATDPETYDKWFREKVQEALNDSRPTVPHAEVMAGIQKIIDKNSKRD